MANAAKRLQSRSEQREAKMNEELRMKIRKAMLENSKRYLRTKLQTDQMFHMIHDYIPANPRFRDEIWHEIFEKFFEANVMFITVRPEWDAMDKLQIEAAMNEIKMRPIQHPFNDIKLKGGE